ncbi:GFA family protein [Paracoccus tegillarcae]|uniref:GFA family protein n=1 Tax=Paracoccus tegillarcae TaxID=1529068 RepID=UPI001E34646E|nr:GFA family protein [Paracoccus tegillarcae]
MTHSAKSEVRGACLCGEVRFSGQPGSSDVTACHCGQCRKWSGHVWASFHLEQPRIAGPVRWFASSSEAERGFCSNCGSVLFWRPLGRDTVSFSPGALDNPTGLALTGHIFVADKGDYYQIADGLPQRPQ